MKLTKEEKEFFKINGQTIRGPIERRIEELKEVMVFDPEKRNRVADLIMELRGLLDDFKISKPKKIKKEKENYV